MQPINPNQPTHQNQQASQTQAGNKVSEDQANDFSKRMEKKSDTKGKAEKRGESQSLESLVAERRKNSKQTDVALQGKQTDTALQGKQAGTALQGKQTDTALQGKQTATALQGKPQRHGSEEKHREFSEAREGDIKLAVNENVVQGRDSIQTADTQIKNIQSISGPKEINEVINKLVDKIAVSAKGTIEGAEVRISLKDNILPGTEIRIQKVAGELQVTMSTSSADSHNFLATNEASLVKSLNERFGEKVQVNINMSGGDGQPEDGRARQEYIAEEEQDNNKSA